MTKNTAHLKVLGLFIALLLLLATTLGLQSTPSEKQNCKIMVTNQKRSSFQELTHLS